MDIWTFGLDIFGMIFGDGNGPLLREISRKLDQVIVDIEAARVENRQLLSNMQSELNRQGMEASIRTFASLDNNGDEGLRSWMVILGCRISEKEGRSTCIDLYGIERPVAESMSRARKVLFEIVDVRWKQIDLPTLAGEFTGRGAARGLAEASWNYLRERQNAAAGVSASSPIRTASKMPVVTPELASGMNAILDYYQLLIARYAFLKSVAVVEKNAEQNKCNVLEALGELLNIRVCQKRILEELQGEARTFVFGNGPGSVASAIERYRMPSLPKNSIAVAGLDGTRRIYYRAKSADQWRDPAPKFAVQAMQVVDVNELGRALERYSTVENVWAAFPLSFPCEASNGEDCGRDKAQRAFYYVSSSVGAYLSWNPVFGWEPVKPGALSIGHPRVKPQACIVGLRPASESVPAERADSARTWTGLLSCPTGTQEQFDPVSSGRFRLGDFREAWKAFGQSWVYPRWCTRGCANVPRESDQISVLSPASNPATRDFPMFDW